MSLLPALLLLAAPALASEPPAPPPEDVPIESWSSFSMEAAAFVGELRYQGRDLGGARDRFRDSLNSSVKVNDPHGQIVALDLYRTAEFAIREGDLLKARRHLDILVGRYPGTTWADRGKRLLAILAQRRERWMDESPAAPDELAPEALLSRIQTALKNGIPHTALKLSQLFLAKHASHASADEVRLLEGLLLLQLGDSQAAAAALREAASSDAEAVRSKARYLLGAALYARGDFEALRAAVPALDASQASDRWAALSQAWLAAADQMDGREAAALERFGQVARSRFSSPVKAYALSALAAAKERANDAGAPEALRRAAEEADRHAMSRLAASARLALAGALYRGGKPAEASAAYADFIVRYPGHAQAPAALYYKGLSHKRAGRPDPAAAAFTELLERHPDSKLCASAHLQLGQLYAELGSAKKAVSHYERMSEGSGAKPGMEAEGLLLSAQVHYNQKRYKDALPYYQRFLDEYPLDERVEEVSGLYLNSLWLGDPQSPDLVSAVDHWPKHAVVERIRWELAKAASGRGDHREALRQYSLLAADFPASPSLPDARIRLAECLEKSGDPAAAAAYREVVSRWPGSEQAREASFRLGAIQFEKGDYQASAASYLRSEKGQDDLAADALFNRALALSKAGKKAQALPAFEQLLARFPKHPRASWAWLQVGTLREAKGRHAAAAMAYENVRGEPLPQALLGLGRCREKLQQRPLARKAYERLRALKPAADPHRVHGLLRLAMLLEMDAQPMKAMPLYAELIRLDPRGEAAKTALGRLQVLTSTGAYASKAGR